ncbi:hypothetical protein N4T20_03170 [Flavobacterium sp. TR2]|uniref:hypothetical protein n=1 Tax=Flavobacterium sp. TR2 TaxID=2977321 RepID=UPI0021B0EDA9|nr:hypothetical protein [Flavobacterium sp. TR2]UWY28931.1 hypothetical protein N4T20_03170 [Flavobacterium sp. TR2]
MKKKLEADLISIAHRILKLKNKSDINQLYLETQKLYEKLAVLKFVEENFDAAKPTIGQNNIVAELETIFEKEENPIPAVIELEAPAEEKVIALEESYEPEISEEKPAEIVETAEPIVEVEPGIEEITEPIAAEIEEPAIEEIVEPIAEKAEETEKAIDDLSFTTINELKPIPDFVPAFELETEPIIEEVKEEPKKETPAQPTIQFEDFGINYAEAEFVKVDSFEAVPPVQTPSINDFKEEKKQEIKAETAILETPVQPKAVSLNEKLARGFHIDLNDRIAFTKNLFGNSTEDYSRVLNQLMTFDSYSEAKDFIEDMVKPDYNNWEGKDDYAERFLGIIEKKFS